jgi:large subunit ribosomal protein L9
LQKVDGLGKKGDIVETSKGYARNFLLPQKLAKIVNQKDIDKIEREAEAQKLKIREELAGLKDIKQQLAKKRVSLKHRATSTGKLYAAVSAQDVARAIYKTYGFRLPVDAIKIAPIKTIGLYPFKIILPDSPAFSAGKEEILMKLKVIPLSGMAEH